ncbi:MAG: hypothetical protein JWN95_2525 [Frankiales bacterium]|nr:hypothetical protein [Frankiales bacterium]
MHAPEANPTDNSIATNRTTEPGGPSISVDWPRLQDFSVRLRTVVSELARRAGSGANFDDWLLRDAYRKLDGTWSGRHHQLSADIAHLADGVDSALQGYREVESELQAAAG